MLKKIYIANRGDPAIRVIRACEELGISTATGYSDVDKNSRFVRYVGPDNAIRLGPGLAKDSYLNIPVVLQAIKDSGADAVHVGWGFLAENSDFRDACEKAGITYIGPSKEAIDKMGGKITAKKIVSEGGIPVIPGGDKPATNYDEALDIARSIGFPVFAKPVDGGGGKGAGIAYTEKELDEIINTAQRIGKSAFGSDGVLIEKYIDHPRHIEFQILADQFDNIVHVGERECSIQRGHQKLIEECPSPMMTPELRREMGEVAVKVARLAGYTNAGTVEFLYNPKTQEYYFMEMNTRLQVEHPVTEEAVRANHKRIDLVKEQIRIASGEELAFTQDEIYPELWAIECRLNAEDTLNNFAPSPGTITRYASPGGGGIRVESGIETGSPIPPFYDSMITKIVAVDNTRKEAIARMRRALGEYVVEGVTTNKAFHQAVMSNPHFINGELTTGFIIDYKDELDTEIKRILGIEDAAHTGMNSNVVTDKPVKVGKMVEKPQHPTFIPDPKNEDHYLIVIGNRSNGQGSGVELREIWGDISCGTPLKLYDLKDMRENLNRLQENGLIVSSSGDFIPIRQRFSLTQEGNSRYNELKPMLKMS